MSEAKGPETRFDPSGNTEAFQAFARTTAPEIPAAKRSSLALIIGAAAAVIIVAVVVILLVS